MWDYLKRYAPPGPYDRNTLGTVLLPILIAVVMLTTDRFGLQNTFIREFGPELVKQGVDPNNIRFLAQVYFSAFALLFFVGIPFLFHIVFPANTDNPFGFRWQSAVQHMPVYAAITLFMIPVLWFASAQPNFYHFYPMYNPPSVGMWLLYEAVYMLQFFSVEFFFRGFALFRLEPRFGYHAITIMVVPYALLHIHKPFPEALASIVAGLVLGMLAMKSRSIWPGLFIHCTVAFSMDLFALIHSGRFGLIW